MTADGFQSPQATIESRLKEIETELRTVLLGYPDIGGERMQRHLLHALSVSHDALDLLTAYAPGPLPAEELCRSCVPGPAMSRTSPQKGSSAASRGIARDRMSGGSEDGRSRGWRQRASCGL